MHDNPHLWLTGFWGHLWTPPLCPPPPLGGRVSHEALYRGRIVDKHRKVDKGWHHRNRRYTHDGDLVGIVGPALAFSSTSIVSSFSRNYLSLKLPLLTRAGLTTPERSRNDQRNDQSLRCSFQRGACRKLCFAGDKHFSDLSMCTTGVVFRQKRFLRCLLPAKYTCCALSLVLQMEFLYPSSWFFWKQEGGKQNKLTNEVLTTQRILNL